MAEKVIILEADINVELAIKETAKLKERVDQLKESTAKLKKEQGETSSEYIKANAELKATQDELRDTENLTKKLTAANRENSGTIQKLEAENAKLRKEQKSLNLETKEGIKRNGEINKKINENTDIISANSDKMKQQKMNIGNYESALDGLSGGFLSATKSALKFIATPIGAIIAAIVVAVMAVVKAFSRSEESMNKVKKVTGALSGVFSGLLNLLKPVVNFIADNVIVVFEALGKVAEKTLGLVSKGLRFLGFDKAAASVDQFSVNMKEAAKAGMELANMEAELQKRQRLSQKIQLDYQKQAEKLRQLRDDETKTVAQRIKYNDQLSVVLKKQQNDELAIANLGLAIAEKRIKLEGESTSNLDALAEAQTRVSDIQERITGQQSEQLSNLNGLRREAIAISEEQRKKEEEEFKAFENEINGITKESNAELRANIDEGNRLLTEQLAISKEEQARISEQARLDEMARIELDYENKKILANENIFSQLEFQRQELEAKREQEIRFAETIGADVEAVKKKYDRADLELEKAKLNAKLALANEFFGNIATLFGENTAVGKAAAVAQTTISTFQGATQAFSSLSSIPVVGPALGAVAAAAAVASGLANVKKILSVKSGLPGDKSVSANTSGGGAPVMPTATSASIGQGIVSRNVGTSTGVQIANATNQQQGSTVAVVVDRVTAAQDRSLANSEMGTI